MDNANLKVALSHAKAGIPIFPAQVFREDVSSSKWKKQPLISGWQKAATTDENLIRSWWKNWPNAVPGIELGRAGLMAIDADRHGGPDGVEALGALVKQYGGITPGPATVPTAGGGHHYFFQQPKNRAPFSNAKGSLPTGIDVRGTGGWIIAPGSMRQDGQAWQPAKDRPALAAAYTAGNIPPVPPWVGMLIDKAPDKTPPPRSNGVAISPVAAHKQNSGKRERNYATAALKDNGAELARMLPDTGRNETLNKKAYRLGRMAARGWLDQGEITAVLFNACQQNGLVKEDGTAAVRRTIESGLAAGLLNPHEDLPQDEKPPPAKTAKTASSRPDAEPRPASSEQDDAADLERMNSRYAVVKISGKTRVVEFEQTAEGHQNPVFSTIGDFRAFHGNKKKSIPAGNGNTKEIGLGQWWINHAERRQFEGIVYAPNQPDNGRLNLWTGFACEPSEGDCDLYLDHLRDNICSGDAACFDYLLNWMAYTAQHPDCPGEVAVVVRGKQGVGKGMFAKEFGALFGSHFRHVVHAHHLTGNFNSHLQHCSLLFADEAFFAGDRSHESVLKALITEENIMVELKGVDAFQARNCIHLIMASNARWVVPADADARRYFVLDASDQRAKDTAYFGAIKHQMDHGGREELLHFLLHRDISRFNVRIAPHTAALDTQKQLSRRGVDLLIETIAHDGQLPSPHPTNPSIAITTIRDGKNFHTLSLHIAPDLKYLSPINVQSILKKDWQCKPFHSGNLRGLRFPPLDVLRRLFDEHHGPQDWGEDEEDAVTTWSSNI